MTLWRLEWLRIVRTRRLFLVTALFTVFGLTGPVLARWLPEIVERTGPQIQVTVPEPVPADGIAQFASNAQQIGLIVAVAVAAAGLAIDARPALAVFYRTRVDHPRQLVLPRFAVTAAVLVAAYVLGTLAATYETVLLLGALDPAALALGTVLVCLYLVFVVAVVAAAASLVRSVLGVVATSLAVLLALPLLAMVPAIAEWVPSALVGAQAALARSPEAATAPYAGAAGVTVATTAALLSFATWRLGRRETES